MPMNTRRIDKHKHLGAYGNFSPELHVQGGKDQVRGGHDWSTRLWDTMLPCHGVSILLKRIPSEGLGGLIGWAGWQDGR